MIQKIPHYSGVHQFVSIAKDEMAKEKLCCELDGHTFWYLSDGAIVSYPSLEVIPCEETLFSRLLQYNNYDVLEIEEDGSFVCVYDDATNDNVIFITGRCNSNCVMCPSSEGSRKRGTIAPIDYHIELAKHIPTDTDHITITGGEPFIIGNAAFRLLKYLRDNFERTEFLILTNGRIFALNSYCDQLKQSIPSIATVGIPVHASNAELHDWITQCPGSFEQTWLGIQQLLKREIPIELRIVVTKLNVFDLPMLAKRISEELPDVLHVCIMAMEMTGNAHKNRDLVWLPYRESMSSIKQATDILLNSGIDVRLYNFPLCTVDAGYWPSCKKSISCDKIRFAKTCTSCKVKDMCGGTFSGTFRLLKQELAPVL